MTDNFYAGVGSRQTPERVTRLMSLIASQLENRGWVLRTGGAEGADAAFLDGIREDKAVECYLPWQGFGDYPGIVLDQMPDDVVREAMAIAQRIHPAWNRCSSGARKLHTRNVFQVLGFDLGRLPSKCVICWTPDGQASGGTGLAIRLAKSHAIPVLNLHDADVERRVRARLGLEDA